MIIALGAALLLLVVAMAGAWAVQRRTGNSGWIDTIWSFSVGISSLVALVLMPGGGNRRWLLAALITFWAMRLGGHIVARTRRSNDDPRYAALIAGWGAAAPFRLFLFLQIQALSGAVLVGAVMLADAAGHTSTFGLVSILGTVVFSLLAIISVLGEAISDQQLADCKRNRPANGICETGFWAYSRHPNYVFEWLFWASVAGLALSPPQNIVASLALCAPLMMYVLLRYGSGVPHVEAHMRRTRPEAFAAYAARVPVFFPRFWS